MNFTGHEYNGIAPYDGLAILQLNLHASRPFRTLECIEYFFIEL